MVVQRCHAVYTYDDRTVTMEQRNEGRGGGMVQCHVRADHAFQ